MKRLLLLAFIMALSTVSRINAQNYTSSDYNFRRAREALEKNNFDEALEYFVKDLEENPYNGRSYSWCACILEYQKEYGNALTSANKAIQHIRKNDTEYIVFAHGTRAKIYLNLQDTVSALNDIATAIKANPEKAYLYEMRGQLYYEQGKFRLSDADYRKMIEINPGDVSGYLGLGRNANMQRKWDEAINQFNFAERLSNTNSKLYAFRAEAYMGKGDYNKATNDIVSSLDLDWDIKALLLTTFLDEQSFNSLIAKIKIKAAKEPGSGKWPYLLGYMYEQKSDYDSAIKYYDEANNIDISETIYYRIAYCYNEMGLFKSALHTIEKALSLDANDSSNLRLKASILYDLGRIDETIAIYDELMKEYPEWGIGYCQRAWYKQLNNDYHGAIEDLNMGLVILPDYAYGYMIRGNVYDLSGRTDLAVADFRKAADLVGKPENEYETALFAYIGLKNYKKVKEILNSFLAEPNLDSGDYYNVVCVYSRMGEADKAVEYLEKALKMGYNNIEHIKRDHDLDNIRNHPKYKSMLKEYEIEREPDISEDHINEYFVVKEVPFTKESGVCKVKCEINGLPLHFVFDTGASTVSISMVEATFMLKNGYVNRNDIIGSQNFIDANGNISVGTVINLKKVDFGGLELTNVRASVVNNQMAPLLLGQSVLGRLGKIEIDNQKQVIKITQSSSARKGDAIIVAGPPPPPPPLE